MSADWKDLLDLEPQPIVRGTDVSVDGVLERLAEGWSNERLLAAVPGLTEDGIRACLAYGAFLLRKQFVEKMVARGRADLAAGRVIADEDLD